MIAPFIVASVDRRRISWTDFRDYAGVFTDPVGPTSADHEGAPWALPDIHFDRDQYLAEVRRATDDRSWETAPREQARLLEQHLKPMNLIPPPDLTLRWVGPAWHQDGLILSFDRTPRWSSSDLGRRRWMDSPACQRHHRRDKHMRVSASGGWPVG